MKGNPFIHCQIIYGENNTKAIAAAIHKNGSLNIFLCFVRRSAVAKEIPKNKIVIFVINPSPNATPK